jgi:hypothetical protein
LAAPLLELRSQRVPFITLHASGLDGPRQRQRVLVRRQPWPAWLSPYVAYLRPEHCVLLVSMGRAVLGSQTRIQSIVVYSGTAGRSPFACVYVEEVAARGHAGRVAAPVHVVRCASLPSDVRFVELSPRSVSGP